MDPYRLDPTHRDLGLCSLSWWPFLSKLRCRVDQVPFPPSSHGRVLALRHPREARGPFSRLSPPAPSLKFLSQILPARGGQLHGAGDQRGPGSYCTVYLREKLGEGGARPIPGLALLWPYRHPPALSSWLSLSKCASRQVPPEILPPASDPQAVCPTQRLSQHPRPSGVQHTQGSVSMSCVRAPACTALRARRAWGHGNSPEAEILLRTCALLSPCNTNLLIKPTLGFQSIVWVFFVVVVW